MNHQGPWNFSATCENDESDQSRKYGLNSSHNFPDISSVALTQPSNWSQISASMDVSTSQVDDLHNTVGFLLEADQLNFQISSLIQQANTSNIASQPEFSCESDKGQSSGTKGRPDHEMVLQNCQSNVIDKSEELRSRPNDRRKRNRSAEVHKLCEKRRRNKINQRMKVLQELIPNCNKPDRVSMLEDAINYVKALKLQVEMMSAGAGVVLQDQYTSPGGIQSAQASRFSPFLLPMRPNMSWGKCYSTGFDPMIPVPSASFHPLISAEGKACLSLMSSGPGSHAIPQLQMPFSYSEQFPTSIYTSTIPTQDLRRDSCYYYVQLLKPRRVWSSINATNQRQMC